MTAPLAGLAGLLSHCQGGITALMRRAVSASDRAEGLADLLAQLLPTAARTVCLLGDDPGHLAIRPDSAALPPEQHESLRRCLSSLGSQTAGVQALAYELPLLAAGISEGGHHRGYLALVLPGGASADEVARAEALLAIAAPAAASAWAVEALRTEQAELDRFALVGQAFLGLAHDLNNALNSMMLQTSVVQLRVDESVRPDLAAIRQQGAQAAGLLRSLQHVVQERREHSYPVALNAVVAEVLREHPHLCPGASLSLSEDDPRISSTYAALKQLVRLVLQGASAGSQSLSRIRMEKRGDNAVLTVTMPAPPGASEGELPSLDAILWDQLDEVSRQAGRSLLRQLGGTAEFSHGPDGTITLSVLWGGALA